MSKSTEHPHMKSRLTQEQRAALMLMASSSCESEYDGGDGAESREMDSEDNRLRSHYTLHRCMAWSIDEQDDEEDEGSMDSVVFTSPQDAFVSMTSLHSALADVQASIDTNNNNQNVLREIHWDSQVTNEKDLQNMIYHGK